MTNTSESGNSKPDPKNQGTTKRRQYYNKQVAKVLRAVNKKDEAEKEEEKFHLYSLKMRLTCPIPEDQNTRGRKIFCPEESTQRFGVLVREELPPVSQFPIYTRSGS